MKKFGKVVLIVLAVIAAIIVIAFSATSGLPKAADAFFTLIGQGQVEAAYRSTAQEFQAATSPEQFTGFLSASALDQYARGRWTSRSIENKQGKLEGTVTTRTGGEIPLTLEFVKENGEWKLLTLRKSEAGITGPAAPAAPTTPAATELQRMTGEAMGLLADAINRRDFNLFHRSVAPIWQKQTTPDELKSAFSAFIERRIDLTPLVSRTPVFTREPSVDGDGVLAVEGRYDVDPPVKFTVKFFHEQSRWQLMGINVKF